MSAAAITQVYRYSFASEYDAPRRHLCLAAQPEPQSSPLYFQGRLQAPRLTCDLLRGLMRVVQSRFFAPPAMLAKTIALSDPVVTCSDEMLRFEGFSACCGAYARVDLTSETLDGQWLTRGTTNVDFNAPMLSALAMVQSTDEVQLAVGADEVRLTSGDTQIVERKVELPIRWLKGLMEVQVCQSRMEEVISVSALEGRRFLRGLPRMHTHRRPTWIVPARNGLRVTQVENRDAVRVGGLQRLRVLEPLVTHAGRLQIYHDPVTSAAAFVLDFPGCRFHLVLSPEIWRGFSGEGQVLSSTALSSDERDKELAHVRAALHWDTVLDPTVIAARAATTAKRVTELLGVLSTQGVVGFDLSNQAYFHRLLPFDLESLRSSSAKMQPRLAAATKLINEGKVRVGKQCLSKYEIMVASSDVVHRVRIDEQSAKCSCPWYAKHQNDRGPCKHILAAQIFLGIQ
ncbi:SWIM zinc finger family protein [Novipirellula caenicola]|uniref:SWIM-type domain-containing protein n=1 Tax=Novipirellula caenicola TaxID=1536901 RepID=A0ABP9VWG8_9BACT